MSDSPIVPKPESRGGQPAAPAPEDEAAEPRGKIGFDGQGGIGEGRLLGHAERRGPDRAGNPLHPDRAATELEPDPRHRISSGVPQGPGTLPPT